MSGLVVVGDLMTDVVTRVDDPLSLGSDTAATVRTRLGGAGGNVATWVAAQGIPCTLVGRVGDDPFGREAVAALAAAGVTPHVGVDPHVATGACVVLVGRDGERTMLPDAGANSTLSPDDLPVDDLRRTGHLHVSGYTLLNPGSRAAGTTALAVARTAGVSTSVDASSAAPLEAVGSAAFVAMTRDVDLLLVTLDEAAVLCESRDPAVVAARLTAHYPQVVLKLGGSGAWWCADGQPTRTAAAVPASGAVVDTTGAGDAFAAGYLAATLTGSDVDAALANGCRLGAAAVTRQGARP